MTARLNATSELLYNRIKAAEREMAAAFNSNLYGDTQPSIHRKFSLRKWLAMWRCRFVDAWAVLRGRADIC